MYIEINRSQSQASYSFGQLKEELEALEEKLALQGLRVSGAGRFAEYRRCIERAASYRPGHVGVEAEDLVVLFRAMIETHELSLILEGLATGQQIPGWKEKMQISLGGTPDVGARQHDHARDTQFELYLAAIARKSGFDVRIEEPDVVCFDEEWSAIALAAKRIQSERRIERHLRKASSQLKKAGTPGIVALDLTWAVPGFSAARQGSSNEAIGQLLHDDVEAYVRDHAGMYRDQIDLRWAYAILVHVAAPCVIGEAKLGMNRVFHWLNFYKQGSPEGAAVLSFSDKLRGKG